MKRLLAGLCWEHWWSARQTSAAIALVSLSRSGFRRSINVNPARRDPSVWTGLTAAFLAQTLLWSLCPMWAFGKVQTARARNACPLDIGARKTHPVSYVIKGDLSGWDLICVQIRRFHFTCTTGVLSSSKTILFCRLNMMCVFNSDKQKLACKRPWLDPHTHTLGSPSLRTAREP